MSACRWIESPPPLLGYNAITSPTGDAFKRVIEADIKTFGEVAKAVNLKFQ